MEISEIKVYLVKPSNGLIGFCSFVIDGCFYAGNIAIFTRIDRENGGASGYRLVYPNRTRGDKSFDIFHPINKETSLLIEQQVTEVVDNLMTNSTDETIN